MLPSAEAQCVLHGRRAPLRAGRRYRQLNPSIKPLIRQQKEEPLNHPLCRRKFVLSPGVGLASAGGGEGWRRETEIEREKEREKDERERGRGWGTKWCFPAPRRGVCLTAEEPPEPPSVRSATASGFPV